MTTKRARKKKVSDLRIRMALMDRLIKGLGRINDDAWLAGFLFKLKQAGMYRAHICQVPKLFRDSNIDTYGEGVEGVVQACNN